MRRVFLLLTLLGGLAACGGGGSGSPVTPSQPGSHASDVSTGVKIFVPAAASQAKRSQFIVPGTQSVRIRVYTVAGATPSPQPPDTIAQISATAPGCSSVNGGISCTIVVNVPINPFVVLEILSYASTDGSGTPLAQGFVTVDSTQPNITPPPVALGGVVSSIVASPSALVPPVDGTVQTLSISIIAKDASGNTILPPGNFPTPISLSVASDPNGAISFSPNPLQSPSASGTTTVNVRYDSSKTLAATSIIAAAGSVKASVVISPQGNGSGTTTAGYRVYEYAIPSGASSQPWNIIPGPDGQSLWFTEHGTNKVAALFPSTCTQSGSLSCKIIEGAISANTIDPTGIASLPNGLVYVAGSNTSASSNLTSIQSAGCSDSSQTSLAACAQTAVGDPVASASYAQLVHDSAFNDLEAAMSAGGSGVVGQISPGSYSTPNHLGIAPFGISETGWVTDPTSDAIYQPGNCVGDCSFSNYSFVAGATPQGIVNTVDGDLIVADSANSQLVYFLPSTCSVNNTPNCSYNSVPTLTPNAQPEFLVVGPDGYIYFTEFAANKIGVFNESSMSMVAEIPVPTTNAGPWGITVGPDGHVWFTEYNTGKIGVIVP
ncbi:MAG TPA: hypothetical protein VFN49_01235 [Candidatus Aquilonibacter sp.]|nr:hypothetical protein [Candidatus Aquilonibacter sp.]